MTPITLHQKIKRMILLYYPFRVSLFIILLSCSFLMLSNELFSFSEEVFLLVTFLSFFTSIYILFRKFIYNLLNTEINILSSNLKFRGTERFFLIEKVVMVFKLLLNTKELYKISIYNLYLSIRNFVVHALQSFVCLDINLFLCMSRKILISYADRHNFYPSKCYLNSKVLSLLSIQSSKLSILNYLYNFSNEQIFNTNFLNDFLLRNLKRRSIRNRFLDGRPTKKRKRK